MHRTGAIRALLDIYQQAISSLKEVITAIPDEELTIVYDPHTADEDCRSIQTILTHVVYSGLGYASSISNHKGGTLSRPEKAFHLSVKEYLDDLDQVFQFTEQVFSRLTDEALEQLNPSQKIKTGWGQSYDIEQLTEHAIVHILRHKRQIERFLIK